MKTDLCDLLHDPLSRKSTCTKYARAAVQWLRKEGSCLVNHVEVGEDEMFFWWLPAFLRCWEPMCADVLSCKIELAELELCFGNGMHALHSEKLLGSDHQLMQELTAVYISLSNIAESEKDAEFMHHIKPAAT
eukprot:SAG31_NODE_24722_length_475_cov_1.111702_1_plen_132_part_10